MEMGSVTCTKVLSWLAVFPALVEFNDTVPHDGRRIGWTYSSAANPEGGGYGQGYVLNHRDPNGSGRGAYYGGQWKV